MQNRTAGNLGRRALLGALRFAVFLGLLIFLPAGSLDYWQGWLFWINFSVCMAAITLYFLRHDRALIERRMNAGPAAERETSQKRIQVFASIFGCSIFVVSALDHRFGWSIVPTSTVIVGNGLVALGFLMVFCVFRENSFASAIVEVGADQKVISTGPYALVRHPMYASALVLVIGAPLALGSWWGLLTIVPMLAILVLRLLDEEKYLARNLAGYEDYCRKVRYRLVPGVW